MAGAPRFVVVGWAGLYAFCRLAHVVAYDINGVGCGNGCAGSIRRRVDKGVTRAEGGMKRQSLTLLLACTIACGSHAMSYAQDAAPSDAAVGGATDSHESSESGASENGGVMAEEHSEVSVPGAPSEGVIKFSDEQIVLNNQAVDAGNAGDYKKAEQLFLAMLQGGEMNVIWGNLGSVYAKQGKCIEAKDAFERVWKSPKITEIPAATIEQGAVHALENLKRQCSSSIVLKCSPTDMTVAFDDGREFPCSSEILAVTPGKHVVLGKTSYGFNSVVVNAIAGETTYQTLEVIDYERIASDAGVSPEQLRQRSRTFKIVGYTFLGVGIAAAVTGVALLLDGYIGYHREIDAYFDSIGSQEKHVDARRARDKAQTEYYAAYGLFGIGGAMIVAGIALTVYDALKIRPRIEAFEDHVPAFSWTVSPVFSSELSGFAFTGQF